MNLEGIDFGVRIDILKQCNLIITRLIDSENVEVRNEWLELRGMIESDVIEIDEELDDEDRYFITKSEDKYKYKLAICRLKSSE